jgi:CubicO group peptidase (beta-lactamase class C family)
MSKPVTVAAAMALARILALTDPVTRWGPELSDTAIKEQALLL